MNEFEWESRMQSRIPTKLAIEAFTIRRIRKGESH